MAEIEKLSLEERKALLQKIDAGIKAEEKRLGTVPKEVLRRAKEVEQGQVQLVAWEDMKAKRSIGK